MALELNISLLEKVQRYCDKRCYLPSFGYDVESGNWDDATDIGLIGIELARISASIDNIFELLNSDSL